MTVFANETDYTAQAAHADSVYKTSAYVAGLTSNYASTSAYAVQYGGSVYADHQARAASAYAGFTTVTNANLATTLNSTTNATSGLKSYSGGQSVTVASTKATGDVQDSESLEQEVRAHAALALTSSYGRSQLYTQGGPIGNYSASNYSGPYVDAMWLVEISKQTGTKLF